ncbi:hypothetical protein B566_EDAN001520 [Ephemera danica]|nr:hypothetical protein B566_EDAN001520 [Ephemera danica]
MDRSNVLRGQQYATLAVDHGQKKKNGGVNARSRPQEVPALVSSDARTPLAWQHRNHNYQQQQQLHEHQATYIVHNSSTATDITPRYPTTLRTLATSTSRAPNGKSAAWSRNLASSQRIFYKYRNFRPVYLGVNGLPMAPTGTWDGEPCPIHHLPGALSIAPHPPPSMILPPHMATLPSHTMPSYVPPAPTPNKGGIYMLLPPMMRPRPLVLPAAEAASNGQPEPLPIRDPKTNTVTNNLFPSKGNSKTESKSSKCHGHTVVLWFIITVITVGITLVAVLRFVIG